MPMALLVTLVAMSLSAAMAPVVMTQVSATRAVAGRTTALDAAQAGIDAAVAQLRAATAAGNPKAGQLENLPPCVMTGSQDVGKKAGTKEVGLRYRITIKYFGLPASAVDDTPEELPCPPTDVPSTATLTATGTGSGTGALTPGSPNSRTIEATYTFKTNNQNIDGGAIQLASPTTNRLCMDAGSSPPPATGTAVFVRPCKSDIDAASEQRWAYTTELNIKLVGSDTSGTPAGLCLDAPVPHANNGAVTLQPCLGRTARQQWSLTDSSTFRGTTDGVNLDNYCLNASVAGATGALLLGGCSATSNRNVFRSQAKVGAGTASAATGQLVNYKQFSRCLDVTNFDVNMTYMIVWFCKQAPDGNVSWNQKWTLPPQSTSLATAVPERIRTAGSGNPGYCLRTPTTTAGYVTLASCTLSGPLTDPRLIWTIYGDTGDYTTSYRIVDSNGYCLTPTDLTVTTPDTHSDGTSKVKVATCSGSELQKWNAPANFNKPLVLTNTQEK
ncbi:hypothetical protein Asp14428_35200 [Actinoplanes sp. NBRC 14428]|nr:hypothetical protein Asp14428_35200 [Actinoplanes sp. NBRC 14428]